MNHYEVGDAVRVTVTFRDLNGAVADPTTVVAKYRRETDAVTTKTYGTDAEVVRDSLGVYHIDITPSAAGTWHARFAGTGAVIAAAELSFLARSNF
jgi:ribosomal protein L21E